MHNDSPLNTKTDYQSLQNLLNNSWWRLNHLYWIENKEGALTRFTLNTAQTYLHNNLWYRNDILKARQLGISTYTALLILDTCLFTPHYHCGIIDKSLPDAQQKLQKIRLAWHYLDYIPPHAQEQDTALALIGEEIKRRTGISKKGNIVPSTEAKTHISFSNDSHVHIGTNLRGGTLQFLHISELAHTALHHPARAKEIKTGAINTVPPKGIIIKESTHEGGKNGINYQLTRQAMENTARKDTLSPLDFKFFFFSWHDNPEYQLETSHTLIAPYLENYFKELKNTHNINLSDQQRAWYSTMAKTMHSNMKQEYPSTPEEAFLTATHNTIYGNYISSLRSQGKLGGDFPIDSNLPLYTSWDIGLSDHTVIWLIQPQSTDILWIDCYANNQQTLNHYTHIIQQWEKEFGTIHTHLLPHDAGRRDPLGKSYQLHLKNEGIIKTRIIPRTPDIWTGINHLRTLLPHSYFHQRTLQNPLDKTSGVPQPSALEHLEQYTTQPSGAHGTIKETPLHNIHSHTADAARIFAEACSHGFIPGLGFNTSSYNIHSKQRKRALITPPHYY